MQKRRYTQHKRSCLFPWWRDPDPDEALGVGLDIKGVEVLTPALPATLEPRTAHLTHCGELTSRQVVAVDSMHAHAARWWKSHRLEAIGDV